MWQQMLIIQFPPHNLLAFACHCLLQFCRPSNLFQQPDFYSPPTQNLFHYVCGPFLFSSLVMPPHPTQSSLSEMGFICWDHNAQEKSKKNELQLPINWQHHDSWLLCSKAISLLHQMQHLTWRFHNIFPFFWKNMENGFITSMCSIIH